MRALPIALALLVLLAVAPAAQAKEPPVLACAQHIEGDGPLPGPDAGRDVSRGALALLGARPIQGHRVRMGRQVRLGLLLAAGHEATVEVAPASQRVALLSYRFEGSGRIAESHLDLRACAGDEPRFGGEGTVGPRTIWAGGLDVRSPGCVVLQVWVDGARVDDVRLPLGRPCRPPAATRAVGCSRGRPAEGASASVQAGPLGIVPRRDGTQALLLMRGASAAVAVAWEDRRRATLRLGNGPDMRAVRVGPCGDVPALAWPVGLAATGRPACVGLDVWAGGPPRRLRLPVGAPDACRRA